MKRLAYSILIGAGCTFLFWGISKLQENTRKINGGLSDVFKKGPSRPEIYYSGELQVQIGNPVDNIKLIEQTKEQILYRLRGSYSDLFIEKIDKNIYKLKANKILDTGIFKNSIIASGKIEFSELFSLNEITGPLRVIDSVLRNRDADFLNKQKKVQEAKKTLDTATDKLSDNLDYSELEKSQNDPGLAKFISFTPITDMSPRYNAELGYVKTKDTAQLNQILNDTKISGLFPGNLKFLYGHNEVDLYADDSMLKIFAKKSLDRTFFPYPTGDQITEATPSFDPLSGHPLVLFAFNSQGAQDWYLMTKRNTNKPIAIITNNIVLTAPVVETAIEGGQSRITGAFSREETSQLCKMIMSGELALTTAITSASFTYHSSKKFGLAIILLIIFSLSSAASYGISLLIKPASKP